MRSINPYVNVRCVVKPNATQSLPDKSITKIIDKVVAQDDRVAHGNTFVVVNVDQIGRIARKLRASAL